MDVVMGKQQDKNKYIIPLIFGTIILLTGAVFALSSNKKLLPLPIIETTPTTIPSPPINFINSPTPGPTAPAAAPTFGPVTQIKIENLKPGVGAIVASGSAVSVHYIGMLTNGQAFDNSLEKNQPFQFSRRRKSYKRMGSGSNRNESGRNKKASYSA